MILQNGKTFHIQTQGASYVIIRNEQEDLLNFHFGPKIADWDYAADPQLLLEPHATIDNETYEPNLSFLPQEYPCYGYTDQRNPAFLLTNIFGNRVTHLKYKDFCILKEQAVQIPDMPALRGPADTLQIILADDAIQLEVVLQYVVFSEYDIIARNAVIRNKAERPVTLHKACSVCVDLPLGEYDLIHFPGDWGQERTMTRTRLSKGTSTEIADNTGRGSRWNNPFIMVAKPDATETHGHVYGCNLIYSGSHSSVLERGVEGHLRILQGISDQTFSWTLEAGQEFHTPQSVLCFSANGFEGITHRYHDLYRRHLIKQSWVYTRRPILLNSWESCYFDFDEDKLLTMATTAKQAGVDLFVLDDGWFGKRDNDRNSLGDWVVSQKKLPNGIDGLAKKLNALGLEFGLWFEPEMVSPDSDLYRAHPDWVIHVPQHAPLQYRFQYVLDLSRPEIRDYIVDAVSNVLRSANITYVKWDMNRIVCDVPCDGYYHRYCLGYYNIMQRLTEAFPHILFEGCCSGGGRFDPGVLAYMPQIWTSDNTDPICRLQIQYGTSMCYPLSTMGAHVSAAVNHQTNRITSAKTRADVAYAGIFGFELDMSKMTEEDLAQAAQQAAFARHIQPLVLNGRFYRFRSPFETNECIWQIVSEQKDHVFFMACRVLTGIVRNRHYDPKVQFRGLDEDGIYEDVASGKRYSGSLLMHRGITVAYSFADFATYTMELKKI